jgi:lipoyl(octanoyl) transferase
MIETLAGYGIAAAARADAPGVYVTSAWPDGLADTRKIGSLGLRVSRGRSYHGLALNVNMDLEPFSRINPCGLTGMRMTQVAELGGPGMVAAVAADLERALRRDLDPSIKLS